MRNDEFAEANVSKYMNSLRDTLAVVSEKSMITATVETEEKIQKK